MAYKLFCDMLSKEEASKCLLLMHTQPIDENGTDLPTVVDTLCPDYDVMFNQNRIEPEVLNEFYNLVDCTINIASNEGFGLGTAESIMAGTPIIVNVTGGLQDQCGFDYTAEDYIEIKSLNESKNIPHGSWVAPVWGAAININGSVLTPYIFEDRVNDNDVAEAIFKMYIQGKEQRKYNGLAGRQWALENLSSKIMCDEMSKGIDTAINNFKPKPRFNLHKII